MRKGVFARLSRVVIILSMIAFIPTFYFYYVKTAAHAYKCDVYSASETRVACYPISGKPYWNSYDYDSTEYTGYGITLVDRLLGKDPILVMNRQYVQINLSNLNLRDSSKGHQDIKEIDDKLREVEITRFTNLFDSFKSNVSRFEAEYVREAIVVTTIFTIICPLLLLVLIRILMLLYSYVFYGRKDKVVLEC